VIRAAILALILPIAACHAAAPDFVLGDLLPAASGKEAPRVYDVFSGPAVDCAVTVSRPGNWSLLADIDQKGGFLTAPVAKSVPVAKGSGPGAAAAEIALPEVQRTTEFIVSFRLAGGATVSEAIFKAYPRKLVEDEWKQAAAARHIHLFGQDTAMRHFFQARHIPFEDCGEDAPATVEPGQPYIGIGAAGADAGAVPDQVAQLVAQGANVIYIAARLDLPPGIFSGPSRITKVTLPILDHLDSSPLAQEMLIQLITTPPAS
jgi:hypothetical protein